MTVLQPADDSGRASDGDRIRAGFLALGGGIAVLGFKTAAWFSTASSAVLSDALESVVNVAAAGLLLFSLRVAALPADRNHPYGHGKIEFFSAGVEGALIGVAALWIAFAAARELIEGPSLQRLDLGLVLITAASVLNGFLGAYLLRLGRRTGSLALEADGRHLLTDVITSAAVIVGLGIVRLTGWQWLDPMLAIGVALHILKTGWTLVRRAVAGLMDETDPALLSRAVDALERARRPWWIDVHSLRTWRSGRRAHGDLHLVVPRYYDADRLHEVGAEVEEVVITAAASAGEAIVHFDPCRPRHCPTCPLEGCPVREASFKELRPFTLRYVTRSDESLDSGRPLASATVP